MVDKTLAELKDEGFEEVVEDEKPSVDNKKEIAPYVVVDNTTQLSALTRSNELMTDALENIVNTLGQLSERPKGLKMKISRDSSGFMTDVDVTFKYQRLD